MAEYYIAPKTSFDATADAIREKTGSQAAIEWTQDGFADAIEDIESGFSADVIAGNLAPSGDIQLSASVTRIEQEAFRRKPVTHISGAGVTFIGNSAFYYSGIAYIADDDFPLCTQIGNNTFQGTPITTVENTHLLTVGVSSFEGCTNLTHIYLPNCTTFNGGSPIRGNTALTIIDVSVQNFAGYACQNSYVLETMILRRDSVITLANTTNCFQNTPLQGYNGRTVTVYCPSSLINSYKSDTNWSVWYTAGNVNFIALEGSQYESKTWWKS